MRPIDRTASTLGGAVALLALASASMAEETPPAYPTCPPEYVQQKQKADRRLGLLMAPERPCILVERSRDHLCDRKGCRPLEP